MIALTAPQREALTRIASAEDGALPLFRLSRSHRMVDCYRLARSLEAKGAIKISRGSAEYARVTPAGRAALSNAA